MLYKIFFISDNFIYKFVKDKKTVDNGYETEEEIERGNGKRKGRILKHKSIGEANWRSYGSKVKVGQNLIKHLRRLV